jgi:hypothetical protein
MLGLYVGILLLVLAVGLIVGALFGSLWANERIQEAEAEAQQARVDLEKGDGKPKTLLVKVLAEGRNPQWVFLCPRDEYSRPMMTDRQVLTVLAEAWRLERRGELWSFRNRPEWVSRQQYETLRDLLIKLGFLRDGPNRSVAWTAKGRALVKSAHEEVYGYE